MATQLSNRNDESAIHTFRLFHSFFHLRKRHHRLHHSSPAGQFRCIRECSSLIIFAAMSTFSFIFWLRTRCFYGILLKVIPYIPCKLIYKDKKAAMFNSRCKIAARSFHSFWREEAGIKIIWFWIHQLDYLNVGEIGFRLLLPARPFVLRTHVISTAGCSIHACTTKSGATRIQEKQNIDKIIFIKQHAQP